MGWMATLLLVLLAVSVSAAVALVLSYFHLSSRFRLQRWLPWPSTASLAHHISPTSFSSFPPTPPPLPVIGLVIAHPDDETLFFLPTLLHLLSTPLCPPPHLLCLSTGNADRLGPLRTRELLTATSLLPLPASHVLVVDDERLPDSLTSSWPLRVIHDRITDWVRQRGIQQLITFDQGGVSGHPNHRAVHHAVSEWIYAHDVPAWELVTWSVWRKYASIVGGWRVGGDGGGRVGGRGKSGRVGEMLLVHWDSRVNWRCMQAHHSQFVWYRRLFVVFSLYTYVNVLRRM